MKKRKRIYLTKIEKREVSRILPKKLSLEKIEEIGKKFNKLHSGKVLYALELAGKKLNTHPATLLWYLRSKGVISERKYKALRNVWLVGRYRIYNPTDLKFSELDFSGLSPLLPKRALENVKIYLENIKGGGDFPNETKKFKRVMKDLEEELGLSFPWIDDVVEEAKRIIKGREKRKKFDVEYA